MDAQSRDPWQIVLYGQMMFVAGVWIAFECAANLIDFMDTGAITWPHIFKSYDPGYPLLVSYATQPVEATVVVVITALGGLIGGCAVVFSVTDLWKILSS